MKKFAVFAITDNDLDRPEHTAEPPVYSFFAPIASKLWRRMGYTPIVFIVGHDANSYVVDKIDEVGGKIIVLDPISGYRNSTIAQFCRMFGCYTTDDNDYCLTSDVDLLPFDKEYFGQALNNRQFHVWSSNHYGDNPLKHNRFPMCFNGATSSIWKEVLNLSGESIQQKVENGIQELAKNGDHWSSWFFDETFLVRQLKQWNKFPDMCLFMKRGTVSENGDIMAAKRIDRAHWHEDMQSPIDSHSVRPGHIGQNWESLKRIFYRVLCDEDYSWIIDYQNNFETKSHSL